MPDTLILMMGTGCGWADGKLGGTFVVSFVKTLSNCSLRTSALDLSVLQMQLVRVRSVGIPQIAVLRILRYDHALFTPLLFDSP